MRIETSDVHIADTADVDGRATIGAGTSIWHLAQVREDAVLGENCVVGRGAYVGSGVSIGNNCKLQNYALVYEPAVLHAGVFVGPAVVFTNDHFPRAVAPDGQLKTASDWLPVGVVVHEGASIGARAVCVAPVDIGAWALIGAGSVVVRDVPAFALMVGVPARQVGWVGRAGRRLLPAGHETWLCPDTGDTYSENEGVLRVTSDDPSAAIPRPLEEMSIHD